MKHVSLSDHFTYGKIFHIVIGPVLMMIFSSFYSVVDGIFLSNYAGDGAFSGVNLIFPYIMILGGVGFMLGTGGTALVSKTLGEKKKEEASSYFSLVVYATIVIGALFIVFGYFTVEPFVKMMASLSSMNTETMIDSALRYGRTMMLGIMFFMLQNVFQSFFSGAEKPFTGFLFIAGAGVTNIILDWLFIAVLNWKVEGAAIASICGQIIGGVLPIFYFVLNKKLPIHLGKCKFEIKPLLKVFANGSSEFASNIASSVVSTCYNMQLLRYIGPAGVSAYGVCMYINYLFMAIFIGYSVGMAPVVGYNYGAKNHEELHNVFKKSILIVGITGLIMFALGELLGPIFGSAFSNGDATLQTLSSKALSIFSFIYLTAGFSIFGSSFFTALNNGLISAVISMVRSFVFELVTVWLLPLLLESDGVWAAGPIAEIGSISLTLFFFIRERKRYRY
ncbi:MAG TPA: MATE family efflux transporter [Firmicutes bacterium]|nr:MATE family efflux transporter [Bacillota bacterium]